jgi:hypothetical protein
MTNVLRDVTSIRNATLTMAKDSEAPVQLAQATVGDVSLASVANTVVKALSVIRFRGAVTFFAKTEVGIPLWAAVVSFTDDLPDGNWNVTQYDKQDAPNASY